MDNAGLAHLKECKGLKHLDLRGTPVGDSGLAHLKDCKNLTVLDVTDTKVRNLAPLKGLPLNELSCEFKPERDAEVIRSMPTLETINRKPAKEFWKAVDGRKP